ncbi:hypothetical protein KSC_012950 [Ktedonobacter sp. SOSP1-52]|nr:hypothetical protein KSC_012950 [Ktedonobacter sp. SOSP1-52]
MKNVKRLEKYVGRLSLTKAIESYFAKNGRKSKSLSGDIYAARKKEAGVYFIT